MILTPILELGKEGNITFLISLSGKLEFVEYLPKVTPEVLVSSRVLTRYPQASMADWGAEWIFVNWGHHLVKGERRVLAPAQGFMPVLDESPASTFVTLLCSSITAS